MPVLHRRGQPVRLLYLQAGSLYVGRVSTGSVSAVTHCYRQACWYVVYVRTGRLG